MPVITLMLWMGTPEQRATGTSSTSQSKLLLRMKTVQVPPWGLGVPALLFLDFLCPVQLYEVQLAQGFPMCVLWNTRPQMVHEIRVLWLCKFGKPSWKGMMQKPNQRLWKVCNGETGLILLSPAFPKRTGSQHFFFPHSNTPWSTLGKCMRPPSRYFPLLCTWPLGWWFQISLCPHLLSGTGPHGN